MSFQLLFAQEFFGMLNMDYDSYVEKEFVSEILKLLYVSHTQFTGSYFLEFLSLAQSIKTLIH